MGNQNGSATLLRCSEIIAGYGRDPIIRDVSFSIQQGEVLALIGHNGAGKSTLLKAIVGLLPLCSGEVFLLGRGVSELGVRSRLKLGLSYIPQGNRVFGNMTVRENVELSVKFHPGIKDTAGFPALPPELHGRLMQRAGTLSGGERQVVALTCVLAAAPKLVLMDEPSAGLAIRQASRLFARIRDIANESGAGVLVVEQKVREVLNIADRVVVLRGGQLSYLGDAAGLAGDASLLQSVYV